MRSSTGKLADLILADGNPLKDIAPFQKYQEKITLVLDRGKRGAPWLSVG
jgi:imidazolonepropionase-like amidohydrolase